MERPAQTSGGRDGHGAGRPGEEEERGDEYRHQNSRPEADPEAEMSEAPALMEKLKDAQAKLAALRAENAELERRIAAAVDDGDEDRLLELHRRADDLPSALALAEIKVIDLRIEHLREQSAEALKERNGYYPDIKQAELDLKAAKDRLSDLRHRAGRADATSRVSMDVGTLNLRRDALMAQLAERPGRVVRMR